MPYTLFADNNYHDTIHMIRFADYYAAAIYTRHLWLDAA